MNPNIIIDTTNSKNSNTNSAISGVPERDVTSVAAGRGWVPGHDHEIDVGDDGENYCDVPGFETGGGETGALAAPAEDEEADCQGEVEDVCWVDC